ncbi:MAG TPA: methionyl-tRNA formyltransferase [Candidatus Hydrogenedentes bacterium]|nr:methionyl-tRNA formyltransferase [Candidatus Hydrogenedentota bacterium]HRT20268.1 methionyl-tRNA formyltransferase [Candidatus Hydrogenedentota bacterium]HRT64331.1 methionyl-tRNA formyltransferase [Candidatus Hydrogenedentota bacterium]
MRIVFFGTPDLAVPTLQAVSASHDVSAVVCQPDRPQGRSDKPAPPPVKQWASAHGISVAQPSKLNDGSFEEWLRGQEPDACVLVAYGRILKQPLLDVPRHGFLNMHPSLLPRHRGPSPIQSAILCGNEKTGVTIMRLDAGMDTGDILLQECTPIDPDENAVELSDRLAEMGARMMVQALDLLASGKAVFTPQDHARATVTRMLEKADGQIQWAQPAAAIHNLVRAALPWPVAHCRFKGEICRIYRTHLESEECLPSPLPAPGTVIRVERDRAIVACGKGAIAILEIQMPGKKPMGMDAFMRGRPVNIGDCFEDLPT